VPSEVEWEHAAHGGLEQRRFPWSGELTPNGEHRMNVFQGRFRQDNTGEDGFVGTAPAHASAPNGYGLYNVDRPRLVVDRRPVRARPARAAGDA
jgi:sulfatase modifying factor 1